MKPLVQRAVEVVAPDPLAGPRNVKKSKQVKEALKQKMWDANTRWDPAERAYAKALAHVKTPDQITQEIKTCVDKLEVTKRDKDAMAKAIQVSWIDIGRMQKFVREQDDRIKLSAECLWGCLRTI